MNKASVLRSAKLRVEIHIQDNCISYARSRLARRLFGLCTEFAMLRRKLLFNLGLFILLLLGCGIASVGMLQHVLGGLNGAKDAQHGDRGRAGSFAGWCWRWR